MAHLPNLIHDLALILITAGIVTVLFRKIGQPVVLGYIIAGLLVGPNVSLLPTVLDLPSIQIWAEIGVIFLLFALGLDFSFKKLAKVGGAASGTALFEVIGMTALGFFTGRMFGWAPMDCLFLGGILAISSTTIIIRAIEELGLKQAGFVNLVFGILIVEDLFAILLLVLLSTIAVSDSFDSMRLLLPVAKLAFFLVLWFVAGIFLLPPLLHSIRRHANDETLLIVSVGLCFSMVVMTTTFGFSPALGAFFMGSIIAETVDAERVEHLIRPVKDLFAAIFFVSVGMLIDPALLMQYAVPIVVIAIVTILGKFFTTLLGAVISGRNLRHSVQAGASLSQIGEFSFIIATLGLSLKVTSDFLYPIAVGVSALTTFTTPYMIRSAGRIYTLIDGVLPETLRESLIRYEASTQKVSGRKEWKRLLRSYVISIVLNSVIIVAIFHFLAKHLPAVLANFIANKRVADLVGLSIAVLGSAPFFWALALKSSKTQEARFLWASKENRAVLMVLEISRGLCVIALFGFLAPQFIGLHYAAGITFLLVAIFLIVFSKYLKATHAWLEARFMRNLTERQVSAVGAEPPALAPWDAHISQLEIQPNSAVVGKSLEELKVRETFGITIALIERGSLYITAPNRSERLFPMDRVSIIGTDEQIQKFANFLAPAVEAPSRARVGNFVLQQFRVLDGMPYCGVSIRDSGIRERSDGLVVGIERGGKRILNPDSMTSIAPDDLLWIVGDSQKLVRLRNLDS